MRQRHAGPEDGVASVFYFGLFGGKGKSLRARPEDGLSVPITCFPIVARSFRVLTKRAYCSPTLQARRSFR